MIYVGQIYKMCIKKIFNNIEKEFQILSQYY